MEITREEYDKLVERVSSLEKDVKQLKLSQGVQTVKGTQINKAALYDSSQPFWSRNAGTNTQGGTKTNSKVELNSDNFNDVVDNIDDYFDRDTPIEPVIRKTKKKVNIEYFLGSGIMGIIAALLIFIGVASLVTMLEGIPSILKVLAMYAVSFLFVLYGYILVRKEKTPFSVSTLGCGVGSIYVATLVGGFAIHGIHEVAAIFIMVLISFITILIAKNIESEQFKLIGFCGISTAVLLVVFSEYRLNLPVILTFLWLYTIYNSLISSDYLKTKNWTFYTIYGVSYTIQNILVGSFAYSLFSAAQDPTYSKDLITSIAKGSGSISSIQTFVVSYNWINLVLVLAILGSIAIINFIKMKSFTLRCRSDIDNSFKMLVNFTNIFIFSYIATIATASYVRGFSGRFMPFGDLFNYRENLIIPAIYLFAFIACYVLLNYTGIREKSKYAYPVYIGVIGLLYFSQIDAFLLNDPYSINDVLYSTSLPIIPINVYIGGIVAILYYVIETYKARKDKDIWSILALFVVTFPLLVGVIVGKVFGYLIALLTFFALLWWASWAERLEDYSISLKKKYKNYSAFYKVVAYYVTIIASAASLYYGLEFIAYENTELFVVLWSSIITLMVVLHQITYLSVDWSKEKIDNIIDIFRLCRCEKDTLDASYTNNFIFHIVFLIFLLFIAIPEIVGFYALLLSVMVLAMVASDLRYIFDNSIVVETEIVIAFYKLMDNYIGYLKYLVTIGLIVMAIISIIAGNKYNFKNFRIYGLSLIFLSAAKLLVFDFSSSGFGAIGLLLAGILCLCVVFIYNKGNKGD